MGSANVSVSAIAFLGPNGTVGYAPSVDTSPFVDTSSGLPAASIGPGASVTESIPAEDSTGADYAGAELSITGSSSGGGTLTVSDGLGTPVVGLELGPTPATASVPVFSSGSDIVITNTGSAPAEASVQMDGMYSSANSDAGFEPDAYQTSAATNLMPATSISAHSWTRASLTPAGAAVDYMAAQAVFTVTSSQPGTLLVGPDFDNYASVSYPAGTSTVSLPAELDSDGEADPNVLAVTLQNTGGGDVSVSASVDGYWRASSESGPDTGVVDNPPTSTELSELQSAMQQSVADSTASLPPADSSASSTPCGDTATGTTTCVDFSTVDSLTASEQSQDDQQTAYLTSGVPSSDGDDQPLMVTDESTYNAAATGDSAAFDASSPTPALHSGQAGTASTSPAASGTSSDLRANQSVSSLCSLAKHGAIAVSDRYHLCTEATVRVLEYTDGALTGSMKYTEKHVVSTSRRSAKFSVELRLNIVTDAWEWDKPCVTLDYTFAGANASPATISPELCLVGQHSFDTSITFHPHPAADQKIYPDSQASVVATTPGDEPSPPQTHMPNLARGVRCDAMKYFSTAGCVVWGWVPQVLYKINQSPIPRLYAQSAEDYREAQLDMEDRSICHNGDEDWTCPSKPTDPYSNALRRWVIPAHPPTPDVLGIARRRACQGLVRVGNETCDEYPYNKTYQNAYYRGADKVYAFAVSGRSNSSAGGVYGSICVNQRLLDNDPFFVKVLGA